MACVASHKAQVRPVMLPNSGDRFTRRNPCLDVCDKADLTQDKGPKLAARVPCKDMDGWLRNVPMKLACSSSACQVSPFSLHLDSKFTT